MPCQGCGKKNMNDPVGLYRMRFIGRPEGKLLKGSPGNYRQGEISMQAYKMCRTKYFELVDPAPVLSAPVTTMEDSVFENQVFIPPELNEEPEQDVTTKAEKVEDLLSPPLSESSAKPMDVPAEVVNIGGAKVEIPNYQELFESIRGMKGKGDHKVNPLESAGPKPLDVGGGFPPLLVKKKVESPFEERRVEPDDDMPPELVAELRTLGDGVIGVGGEEKPSPKKVKSENE